MMTDISSITVTKINGQLAAIARHSDDLNRMVRSFIGINNEYKDTLGGSLWDAMEATSYTLPRLSSKAKDKVNGRVS